MTIVALRLAGPLQSWGSGSRFVRRATESAPTKSGVIGLVAAAKGLRRTDPLDELLHLRFGVRVDQPGQLVRDFQTAQRPKTERDGSVTWKSLPLSFRYYLSDAVYVAVLEGDRALVEGIDVAVRSPQFPLFLGRRSCPPAGPVALGVFDYDLKTALERLPWQASKQWQRQQRETEVSLEVFRDAEPDEAGNTVHDQPVSFDPQRRTHGWRTVFRDPVRLPNPHGTRPPREEHDPMPPLGGG